jgi:hypothetical protein
MINSWFTTVMSACVIALSAAFGCIFDPSGLPGANGGDGGPIDGNPNQVCTPDQSYCDGRVLQMCNDQGTGPVDGAEQICDFTCAGNACVYASNMPASVYEGCDSTAPALTPPAGATVTFIEPGATARIVCNPHCGVEGVTTIDAIHSATSPDRAWFCLSSIKLPGDAIVTYETTLEEAVILLVDSTVEIASTIDFRGGDAVGTTAGAGGPGGGTGGAFSASGAGKNGLGACPGLGGTQQGGAGHRAAGGGGGGGHGGMGGQGGTGREPDGSVTAPGGEGGAPCGPAELIPLAGGSGGGGGADATCGDFCGWPGGGGGGAIQIAARTSILVTSTGSIDTSGGNGHGVTSGSTATGGAGGGGSGGAIVLESPVITIAGALVANGGNGGTGAGGPGGAGASGGTPDGAMGASHQAEAQGGSGGGGGGGRIRINTPGAALACGAFASPQAICTSGALATSPQ